MAENKKTLWGPGTLLFLMAVSSSASAFADTIPCNEREVGEICSLATSTSPSVDVSCHVDFSVLDCERVLGTRNTITKKLIFEGVRDVVFDCNGGRIYAGSNGYNYRRRDIVEIKSRKIDEATWERAENVTIRNCEITGSVRIWGMGEHGEAEAIRVSSFSADHVENVRRNAPTNIVLDRVKITGTGRNPLYFAPGVNHSKLLNSEVTGVSDKVGIYLDAESYNNTIKDNTIHVDTPDGKVVDFGPFGYFDRGWPQLAIDASSHNKILNNTFSSLNEGGIYLYRNCGQGGTVRHTTPSSNVIVNNTFYYRRYRGGEPAVFLGSRDYAGWHEGGALGGHCDDDETGTPRFGSAVSNADHARHNVVMQNQFYERKIWSRSHVHGQAVLRDATLKDMIQSQNWSNNSPNYVDHNELVTDETVDKNRRAGCYLPGAHQEFIPHGTNQELMKDKSANRACYSNFNCNDGDSTRSRVRDCRIQRLPIDCRVEGNNEGCHTVARCPAGKKIVGARAACNLEFGRVGTAQLEEVPFNRLEVVKRSDRESAGECYVGFNKLQSGFKKLQFIKNFPSVAVGCKEHDNNGGDCHVSGFLYCQ